MVSTILGQDAYHETPNTDVTSLFYIAAKSALKRKKAHEHSLEQTEAQIGTLEQQINAIESANINKETLTAMENASKAMKQIHGGLTVDKVDETMYVTPCGSQEMVLSLGLLANHYHSSGTNCGSKTRSAKRSSTQSRATLSARVSTKTSWMLNWRSYNKSSWTSRCSRPGRCPCPTKSSACLLYRQETVSRSLSHMLEYTRD